MSITTRNPFAIVPKKLFALRLKDGSPLDAVDIAAFTALATFADADRFAFPAIDTLAGMIRRKRRRTIFHLRRLEEAGAITSDPRYDDKGRQTSNGYVLNLLKSTPRDVVNNTPEYVTSDTGEDVISDTLTVPLRTEPQEQMVLGAAHVPPAKSALVLFEYDRGTVTGNGQRMTFKQANASGDLKGRCIETALRKFAKHGWPEIHWDLIWEEFDLCTRSSAG